MGVTVINSTEVVLLNPTLKRGDMRYWRLLPDARLRPHVLCYFLVEPAPHIPPAADEEDLLIPDGYSEIVFNLTGSFERWAICASTPRTVMRSSYIIGGRSHSVVTRNVSRVKLAGVKLDPRALRTLIGIPLSEFRDSTLTLPELNATALLDLEDAVAGARSADELTALLNGFFLNALCIDGHRDWRTDHLMDVIRGARGALSIMDWAREQNIDSRSLERHFCAWTGMTPKQYARIVRFKRCYHRLISSSDRRGGISRHLDGYCDQSHFNRDFRYFTGGCPRDRIRGELPRGTIVSDHLLEGELAGDW